MSIRLRNVGGLLVALCGYETDEQVGDVYLDDNAHYAIAAKFARDFSGTLNLVGKLPEYPAEWSAMDTQKLRDATTRTDL